MTGSSEDTTNIIDNEVTPEPGGMELTSEKTPITSEKKTVGLGVAISTSFLVGELAGTGILALPAAIENAGWVGFPLIVLSVILACYSAVILGNCWNMAQERWPKFRVPVRDPYIALGEEAYGKPMSYIIRASIYFLHIGATVVFLLIASQNIQSLLSRWSVTNFSFCYWLLIITLFLIPFTWLGTPKDFWPVATAAGVVTAIACLLIVIAVGTDPRKITPVHSSPNFQSFFLSFGTMLFAVGGISVIPTVQHDMKNPKKFHVAAIGAYTIMIILYLPVSAACYFAYGDTMKTNILQSLPQGGLRVAAELLITSHLVCAYVILFNPVTQDLEELLKVPLTFSWQRVLIRLILSVIILFIGLTIPRFGPILDLIGGSSMCFLTFVAPPLIYLKFHQMKGEWVDKPLPIYIKLFNGIVIFIGVIGGIAASWSAVREILVTATFVPPCYINATASASQ